MAKGKSYLGHAVGRRKSSIARVYVAEGSGKITVNKRPLENYFPKATSRYVVEQPLNLLSVGDKFDVNINENEDDITQLCIINQHLENYIKHKNSNVVMDRCILDGIVYTQYLYNNDRISEWVLDYAKEMYSKLIGDIDIIFYTNPDIPLVDDGERSINKDFRDDIISIFERYINELYQNGIEVVDVSGSVEERIKLILKNTIEKLNQ